MKQLHTNYIGIPQLFWNVIIYRLLLENKGDETNCPKFFELFASASGWKIFTFLFLQIQKCWFLPEFYNSFCPLNNILWQLLKASGAVSKVFSKVLLKRTHFPINNITSQLHGEKVTQLGSPVLVRKKLEWYLPSAVTCAWTNFGAMFPDHWSVASNVNSWFLRGTTVGGKGKSSKLLTLPRLGPSTDISSVTIFEPQVSDGTFLLGPNWNSLW